MDILPGRGERLAQWWARLRRSYGGVLSGLYAATFCLRASFGITVILLSAYLPLTQAAYGVFIATISLVEVLSVPFVGVANDRYGRRELLVAGLGLAVVSLVGRPFSTAIVPNLVFNAMHGASAALVLVTSLSLLADWATPETRGREMGVFDFVNLFGWTIGFILGLLAKDLFGTEAGFWVAAALAGLGILVAWWTVREPPGPRGESTAVGFGSLIEVAANPRVALILAPWLIIFVFIGSFSGFLERLTAAIGLSGVESALSLGVLGVVLLASQVGYGKLSDRYGRGPLILLGAWGFFAFTVATAFLVLETGKAEDTALAQTIFENLPLFGPFMATSFIAMLAFAPAALAALADEAAHGPSGVTMSLYSLVVGLGFIVGPPLTGVVVQFSGPGGLAILLFVEGLGLVGLVLLRNALVEHLG